MTVSVPWPAASFTTSAGIVDEVGVVAGAAGHGVGTDAAVQGVIAAATEQRIISNVTDQGMGVCVAGELQAGRCIRPQSLDLCTSCEGVVDTGHDRVGSRPTASVTTSAALST